MGGSIVIPHAKHKLIENARLITVSDSVNPLIENEQLKQQNEALVAKNKMLEKYIKDNINK